MKIDKALETVARDPDDAPAVRNALGKRRQLADILAAVDERIAACRSDLERLDAEELRRVEHRIPAAVKGGADELFAPDDADTEATQRRTDVGEDLRRLGLRRDALTRSLAAADEEVERVKAVEVQKIVSDGQALHRRVVAQIAEHLGAVAELNHAEREIMDSLSRASGRPGVRNCQFDPCGVPGENQSRFAYWLKEVRQLGYPV